MNILKSFFCSLGLQLLILTVCQGQVVFYVNGTNGNDAQNGQSPTTAWKTIQKSFNAATPGSIVYISGGIYHEQPFLNVSGMPGNPILFQAVTGETVIIDGTSMTGSTMITIIDKSHIRFQDLTIRNLLHNYAMGIFVKATKNGAVNDLIFKNITISNINWTNDPNAMPGSGNNSNPFLFYGTGVTRGNAIRNIVVDSCEIFNNITGYSENLTFNGNVDGAIVSNCKIHHNKNIGICIAGNYNACSVPALDHARNILVYGNTVYNNISQAATSAGIYVDGGRKVLVERNSSYHNGVGIEIGCERDGLTDSCVVRNNIVFDNLDWGIGVGGYDPTTTGQVLYTDVSNNTLYKNAVNNSGMGEFYMPKASYCRVTNNIIYTSGQNIFYTFDAIDPQANNIFDYNCWYAPANNPAKANVNWRGQRVSSFASFQIATGFDQHSFYKNPLFVDIGTVSPNFQLMKNSPCIDSGNPLFESINGETDYAGFQRIDNSRVDVGAFEYNLTESTYELPVKENLIIYPNPCDKVFFIQGATKGSVIKVSDLCGRTVSESLYTAFGHDISGIPDGIYIVTLKTKSTKELTGKLVVSKRKF